MQSSRSEAVDVIISSYNLKNIADETKSSGKENQQQQHKTISIFFSVYLLKSFHTFLLGDEIIITAYTN